MRRKSIVQGIQNGSACIVHIYKIQNGSVFMLDKHKTVLYHVDRRGESAGLKRREVQSNDKS